MLDMNPGFYAQNTGTAAANTVTTITLPAPAKPNRWSIGGLCWSYDGSVLDTSAGIDVHVTLTDTAAVTVANTVLSFDVNDDGVGFIIPAEPFKFQPGAAVQFRMNHGGLGDQKLTILGAKLV